MSVPSPLAAEQIGETGALPGETPDEERLAFEAWMRGHCWGLSATWTGTGYLGTGEGPQRLDLRAMQTRRIWAAWRDRAALARRVAALETLAQTSQELGGYGCPKCGGELGPGVAIEQTVTGLPDFPGDTHAVTVSPGGPGKLVDCVKCKACGWSRTP